MSDSIEFSASLSFQTEENLSYLQESYLMVHLPQACARAFRGVEHRGNCCGEYLHILGTVETK